MKIGIDIRLIGKRQTGSEAVFFNLVKNLVRIDNANHYLLYTDVMEQVALMEIKKRLALDKNKNFRFVPLKTKNKFSWNFWTLPRQLRKDSPDFYLTQYITPFFVPAKIKIWTIIHDLSFLIYPQFIKFSDLFFLRTLIPLAIRRADKVIGVSRFTRDEIVTRYKTAPQKVEFIHNAVSDDFLLQTVTEEDRKKVREKYHLPEKFILYLGTLQPRKNIPTLISAYAQSEQLLPGLKLVIAGGRGHNFDQKIEESEKKYHLQNKIIHTGYVAEEDKKALISAATCFCFPSFYEGFGIPILEAFHCHVPCVISDIPPQREVAGDAALFFPPADPKKLAEKLCALLQEKTLAKRLIEKSQERLLLFSWEKTARRMLTLWENAYQGEQLTKTKKYVK